MDQAHVHAHVDEERMSHRPVEIVVDVLTWRRKTVSVALGRRTHSVADVADVADAAGHHGELGR